MRRADHRPRATKVAAQLRDARFYVSNVAPARQERKGDAGHAGVDDWQNPHVALIRLREPDRPLQGTVGLNDLVKGSVPAGKYKGLVFTVGVPSLVKGEDGKDLALNHANLATAPIPLDVQGMNWGCRRPQIHRPRTRARRRRHAQAAAGPRGERTRRRGRSRRSGAARGACPAGGAERSKEQPKVNADGTITVSAWMMHFGSTGCKGNPLTGEIASCLAPNRIAVRFDNFDPARQHVVLDLAALLSGVDLTHDAGGATGCMSGLTDPECAPLYEAAGLRIRESAPDANDIGKPSGVPQRIFRWSRRRWPTRNDDLAQRHIARRHRRGPLRRAGGATARIRAAGCGSSRPPAAAARFPPTIRCRKKNSSSAAPSSMIGGCPETARSPAPAVICKRAPSPTGALCHAARRESRRRAIRRHRQCRLARDADLGQPALVTLERQAEAPLFGENPVEWASTNRKPRRGAGVGFRSDPAARAAFAKAFPKDLQPIGFGNILKAIATFERALVSAASKYDLYLEGKAQLTLAEMRGKDLSSGKGRVPSLSRRPAFRRSIRPRPITRGVDDLPQHRPLQSSGRRLSRLRPRRLRTDAESRKTWAHSARRACAMSRSRRPNARWQRRHARRGDRHLRRRRPQDRRWSAPWRRPPQPAQESADRADRSRRAGEGRPRRLLRTLTDETLLTSARFAPAPGSAAMRRGRSHRAAAAQKRRGRVWTTAVGDASSRMRRHHPGRGCDPLFERRKLEERKMKTSRMILPPAALAVIVSLRRRRWRTLRRPADTPGASPHRSAAIRPRKTTLGPGSATVRFRVTARGAVTLVSASAVRPPMPRWAGRSCPASRRRRRPRQFHRQSELHLPLKSQPLTAGRCGGMFKGRSLPRGDDALNFSEPFIRRPVGTTLLAAALFLVGVVACFFPAGGDAARSGLFDDQRERIPAGRRSCDHGRLRGGAARTPARLHRRRDGNHLAKLERLTRIIVVFDIGRSIDAAARDVSGGDQCGAVRSAVRHAASPLLPQITDALEP